jgi:two-component sensor histidine kinase/PAS domain-containing protein
MDHPIMEATASGMMPHGHCYLWNPALIALHVTSDTLIALAYTTIPLTLGWFVRKRRDVPFSWMLVCFATFIVSCGMTHWLEVWTLWRPDYWVSGAVKGVTAAASVPTAVLLVRLMPRALAIPSAADLERANAALRERKALYREVLDSSPDPYTILAAVRDHDGRVVDFVYEDFNSVSEAILCAMRGHPGAGSRQDLLGTSMRQTLLPGVAERMETYRTVMATRIPQRFEGTLPMDGVAHTYVFTVAPFRDGVAVAGHDVTAEREAEARLRSLVAEKDVLLREVHHRVKNNLQVISSLLNLQASNPNLRDPAEGLLQSRARVQSIALVHESLYRANDFSEVNLAHYLQTLTSSIAASFSGQHEEVRVVTALAPHRIPLDQAVPVGLLANELLTNAYKHAFVGGRRGEVHVTLVVGEDRTLHLSVRDTGIGLPPGFDAAHASSLGLQLVTTLADQVGGSVEFRGDGGTEVVVHMPHRQEAPWRTS